MIRSRLCKCISVMLVCVMLCGTVSYASETNKTGSTAGTDKTGTLGTEETGQNGDASGTGSGSTDVTGGAGNTEGTGSSDGTGTSGNTGTSGGTESGDEGNSEDIGGTGSDDAGLTGGTGGSDSDDEGTSGGADASGTLTDNGSDIDETEEVAEEEEIDPELQALLDEYDRILAGTKLRASSGRYVYSTELAKFPSSYQTYLKKLHEKHPNWIFVAKNTGLSWNDVVTAESRSSSVSGSNYSLLPKSSASLLLSKASTDYNASKGTYILKDSSTWVSASKPAVAYFVDPRNFLTDRYMFMFEGTSFNSTYHTVAGVQAILKGTDLGKASKITYITTSGGKKTIDKTYAEVIYAAGSKYGISPLYLAAKIKQETGGKLTNGSISGKYKSYTGYYNFFNIGANSGSDPVSNGLKYAKSKKWTDPVTSINGGASYIASQYVKRGQDTVYFQKFNTVSKPYYSHQYMQNLAGAASEANTTYNSYSNLGILNNTYVFYIPVYKSMPSQSSKVTISKSVKTAKTTSAVQLRKGPSTSYSSITTIPKGKTITVNGGVYTDASVSVSSQLSSPYWMKVTYGSKTGYMSANYFQMNKNTSIKVGGTSQLKVSGAGSGEKVYYETSNPAVATVSSSGLVKGVKSGSCNIYAVSSSGKTVDAVGVTVSASFSSLKPTLVSATNGTSGITVKWKALSGAKGYYIYRKVSGGRWSRIGSVSSGSTTSYTDKKASSGKTYIYTVRGYSGSTLTSYNSSGVKAKRVTYSKYKTTAKVNYRTGAGTKYKKKGTFKKGTTIQIENGYSKKANGIKWYRFKKGSKTYYISSKYVKKVSSSSSSTKYSQYKVKSKVNYRTGPGTKYKKKGTLKKGTKIKVVKGWTKKANGKTWFKLYKSGKYYYVVSKYLKKV